jgi:hypothetical protein
VAITAAFSNEENAQSSAGAVEWLLAKGVVAVSMNRAISAKYKVDEAIVRRDEYHRMQAACGKITRALEHHGSHSVAELMCRLCMGREIFRALRLLLFNKRITTSFMPPSCVAYSPSSHEAQEHVDWLEVDVCKPQDVIVHLDVDTWLDRALLAQQKGQHAGQHAGKNAGFRAR